MMDSVLETTAAFGLALRQAREDRGLTQTQLAELANVSQRWLSNFERGQAPRAELVKVFQVARALGRVFVLREAEAARPQLSPEMAQLQADAEAMLAALSGDDSRG